MTEIESSSMGSIYGRKEFEDFALLAFFTPMGDDFTDGEMSMGAPVLFISGPGRGKTALVRAFMRNIYYGEQRAGFFGTEPGALGEAGIGVTPVPVQYGSNPSDIELVFPPAAPFRRLSAGGSGLCFVDEITTARGMQFDAFLTMLQQGKVGDFYMDPAVRRFAAGNPTAMTNGDEIPPAVANRLCWVQWKGTEIDELESYWSGQKLSHTKPIRGDLIEAQVMTEFPNAWPNTVALFRGWLRSAPSMRYDLPDNHRASGPWPSDRSITTAMRMMTTGKILGSTQSIIDTAVQGCIGVGANTSLSAFRHQADLPDIIELLQGKVKFTHNFARIDRSVAVLAGIKAVIATMPVAKEELVREYMRRTFSIVEDVSETAPDILRPLLRTIHGWGAQNGHRVAQPLLCMPEAQKAAEVYGQIAQHLA